MVFAEPVVASGPTRPFARAAPRPGCACEGIRFGAPIARQCASIRPDADGSGWAEKRAPLSAPTEQPSTRSGTMSRSARARGASRPGWLRGSPRPTARRRCGAYVVAECSRIVDRGYRWAGGSSRSRLSRSSRERGPRLPERTPRTRRGGRGGRRARLRHLDQHRVRARAPSRSAPSATEPVGALSSPQPATVGTVTVGQVECGVRTTTEIQVDDERRTLRASLGPCDGRAAAPTADHRSSAA